jgi:Zn-dependent protease with chaperone function
MTISGYSLYDYALLVLFAGTISQIWPIVVLPTIAAFLSDKAARRLPPTRADWRLAAALAAFPGLVMLALIGMIVGRGSLHLHLDDFFNLMKYQVPLAVALGLLGRAGWRAHRRQRGIAALVEGAREPSPRLRAAAAAVSIEVRELPGRGCECFVAGLFRPTAYVSREIVERMSDGELRAALHHERAHAASHDPAMLALLSFLADLAPGTKRAFTAYRQARERRADAEASRREGPCAVASALLTVARSRSAPLPAVGMAGPEAATWRLEAILGVEAAKVAEPTSGLALWSSLGANLGLTAWPAAHIYMAYTLC